MNNYESDLEDLILEFKEGVEYTHPHFEKNGTYCSKIIQFLIWEDNYQALLILNDAPKMMNFRAIVLKTQNTSSRSFSQSINERGVDCYSLRGVDEYFTTKDGSIQCTN